MEWDTDRIIFYFDGKEVSRVDNSIDAFRQPMYLLINLAVGGNWYSDEMKAAKTPYKAWEVDEATMPWKMDVDYVRVYQDPNNLIPPIAESTIPKPAPAAPATPVAAPAATTTPIVAAPVKPANGPTPYPDQKAWEDAVWPGKGPIRTFGWMVDNRKAFWQAREKDQGAVVFAGDSQTAGWKDLAEAFPNLKVANRGIGGDVSRGLLYRFKEDVLDLNPRAVVILIGGNDLSTLSDPAVVEHNLGLMTDMARAQNPKLPIVLCLVSPRDDPKAPIKPGALADLNTRIARVGAGKANLEVIDLYTPFADANGKPKPEYFGQDHLHMATPAYQVWAELVRTAFDKLGVK
jgi:lysophospholipase L1-like esterase